MAKEPTNSKGKKGDGVRNLRRGKACKDGDGAAVIVPGAEAAGPVDFDARGVAEELGLYWQSGKGEQFILKLPDGRWAAFSQQAVVDMMRAMPGRMIRIKAREGEMLSEVKQVFLHTRLHRCLDDVLPALAGYKKGVHEMLSEEKVLVKTEPRLVAPVEGEWPLIHHLIHGRLDLSVKDGVAVPGGIDQTPWFHSWCKIALESQLRGEPGHWRAGHAMILTGPAGCGKNRIQEQVITPLLGRYADPAKFLFQGDDFNSEVFASEHLMMCEVPMPSQKTVDRTALAEKIKQVVANPSQRLRMMREEPVTVHPFWRLTISVNDDPDKLRSLPLITSDFGDKVLVFHCQPAPLLGLEGNLPEEQKAWRDALAREMPAYVHWLLNDWKVPDELTRYENGKDATRFGFREFHHPVIKGELFDDTPAAQLLAIIDAAVFKASRGSSWDEVVEGTVVPEMRLWDLPCKGKEWALKRGEMCVGVWWDRAEELQRLLTGEAEFTCTMATQAKKLFQHNKLTSLLTRLLNDVDVGSLRVQKGDTRDWRGWRIGPPM